MDHSQPPTRDMLNGIMEEARWTIWDGARRRGAPCNPMPPNAYLDAYCLVRNVRYHPFYRGWYDEVLNYPEVWSDRAITVFDDWVHANSSLVQQYVVPSPWRPVHEAMATNTKKQATKRWYTSTILLIDALTDPEHSSPLEFLHGFPL